MKKVFLVAFMIFTIIFAVSCSKEENTEKNGVQENKEPRTIIVLEPDTDEKVTKEQMEIVESVLRRRVDNAGYNEATVSVQGENRVRVEIPSVTDLEAAKELFGKIGNVRFVDSTGTEILTGADFKKATAMYGQQSNDLTAASGSGNSVELTLKPESVAKFTEATREAAGKTATGENYIAIMLDEEVVSMPAVGAEYASTGINTDKPYITGDFTSKEAENLANIINAGQLPFGLKIIESSVMYE